MDTESQDTLMQRLHIGANKLVNWLEPENLAWEDRTDSDVSLDGIQIDKKGAVSVALSFHGWLSMSLENLLKLADRHGPSDKVAEIRSVLEEIEKQLAPRKKAQKAARR